MIPRLNYGRAAWAVAALLTVGVGAEVAWPNGAKPAAPPVAQFQVDPVSGAVAEPFDAWTAAMLGRPLFSPDRRPVRVSAAGGAPSRQDDLPRLAGILILPQGRQAIFAPAGDATRSIVATEGTQVGAWKVTAISPVDVKLTGPDGTRLVRPSFANAPAAPQTIVPPPMPAAGMLLPPAPVDNRPFDSVVQPSGAAIFSHMSALPAARSP